MSPDHEHAGPTRGRGARSARLGRVVAGGAVRWAGDRLDGRGTAPEQSRRRGDRMVATVDALVDQLAVMRGAAMKAGQVLSTIEFPGLEPDQAAYLQGRLASLRDNVAPVGWSRMRKVIEAEWGRPADQVLAEIEREPAAAASIGQVYRGRTHSGTAVAIKVQYPGIAEAVESDMRNLRLLSPMLRKLIPGVEVKALLGELGERIAEECDYELEAGNHRRLARYWRGHPFIRVPNVEGDLSGRRVLVSEWVDGMGFDEVADQPDGVRDRYAEILYRFFYGTITGLDLVLGDPHPGNYLLCGDGRVAFFDFGMLRRLPADYLRREGDVARAIREGDAASMLETLGELGYLPGAAGDWDGELMLDYMREVSWWLEATDRLEPRDLWRSAAPLRGEDGGEHMTQLRRMTFPPEALLLRRMEALLFQSVTAIRARAPWGGLMRELVEGERPVGRLGDEHARWLDGRR
ncbi:MAG TPA: AarF/UbiB family protein [Solirubrobacteraceae bacterium]|nr:AarF/UbiB family protein [Solirubrobacteraceae bacterium]